MLLKMTASMSRWCLWQICTQISCFLLLAISPHVGATCFPAIFNFGDSASDTGGNHAAFPDETAAEFSPYGETYFKEPRSRYSDGRLIIDFIMEGYGMRYLDPYMQSVTSDFASGVTFAISWSTARKVLDYRTVFPLSTQVQQFQLFKKEVTEVINSTSALLARKGLQLAADESTVTIQQYSPLYNATQPTVEVVSRHPYKKLYNDLFKVQTATVEANTTQDMELKIALEAARRIPMTEYFDQGLYIISVGTSDFNAGIEKGQTMADMEGFLPDMVTAISDAIKAIYNEGARNIIVGGVGPIGCLPAQLTMLTYPITDLDNFGCLATINTVVRSYNVQLKQALVDLRTQLPMASIIYLDNYQMQHNLVFNYTQNGMSTGIKSCCGVPSPYNFHAKVDCGESGIVDGGLLLASQTCLNPAEYAIWDGYHYTEAANFFFTNQIFSGHYFDPPFSMLPGTCSGAPV